MADKDETPVPLPSAPIIPLARNATLQPPLTRRGYGPGLIIIVCGDPRQEEGSNAFDDGKPKTLDPLPQKKWAEEGFAVVQLIFEIGEGADEWDVGAALDNAVEALVALETCDVKDRFGLIVYGEPKSYPSGFATKLKTAYDASKRLVAAITFSTEWDLSSKPELVHIAGSTPLPSTSARPNTRQHYYPSTYSPSFILPSSPDFNYAAANVSHTRSLTFLKSPSALAGPVFDLEAIWDEHTALEFATRSVAQTMGTMVDEPYVNHIPVLTGGLGRRDLTRFYGERFIFSNPDDAKLELVSRTVGVDRVVDEFVFSLTHDRVVDWLLPGVPPTQTHLRIPFVAVVNIRGDRLYHEHIHWDQGTALMQAGLLPTYLPFPYALPDGRLPAPGKRFEFRAPVAGGEAAEKLEDAGSRGSNGMFEFGVREVDA